MEHHFQTGAYETSPQEYYFSQNILLRAHVSFKYACQKEILSTTIMNYNDKNKIKVNKNETPHNTQ